MKKEEPKFKADDVVKNTRNNFQRIIRGIRYEDKNGVLEVRYFYSEEKLDSHLKPTGQFNDEIDGNCSQTQLLNWQKG